MFPSFGQNELLQPRRTRPLLFNQNRRLAGFVEVGFEHSDAQVSKVFVKAFGREAVADPPGFILLQVLKLQGLANQIKDLGATVVN